MAINLAEKAKLDRLVCSPYEVDLVKNFKGNIPWCHRKKIMIKKDLWKQKINSDWLVIGRSLTRDS